MSAGESRTSPLAPGLPELREGCAGLLRSAVACSRQKAGLSSLHQPARGHQRCSWPQRQRLYWGLPRPIRAGCRQEPGSVSRGCKAGAGPALVEMCCRSDCAQPARRTGSRLAALESDRPDELDAVSEAQLDWLCSLAESP